MMLCVCVYIYIWISLSIFSVFIFQFLLFTCFVHSPILSPSLSTPLGFLVSNSFLFYFLSPLFIFLSMLRKEKKDGMMVSSNYKLYKSRDWHWMTHKCWYIIKPNQTKSSYFSLCSFSSLSLSFISLLSLPNFSLILLPFLLSLYSSSFSSPIMSIPLSSPLSFLTQQSFLVSNLFLFYFLLFFPCIYPTDTSSA